MFRWIAFFSLFLMLGSTRAHQTDLSSTLLVEQAENKWVVQIRAALTAFDYEIEARFGASAYSTPEEFRELVVQHMRENVSVAFNNGQAAALQNGAVKLGHETIVTFDVTAPSPTLRSLTVRNSSFSNIPRNQGAFMVFKEGFVKDQFMLDNSNDHTVKLKVKDSEFIAVTSATAQGNKKIGLALSVVALVGLSAAFLAYYRAQIAKVLLPPQYSVRTPRLS